MGAHAAADTAIVSLSRARVCQGSKIWNSHPNSQKIETYSDPFFIFQRFVLQKIRIRKCAFDLYLH